MFSGSSCGFGYRLATRAFLILMNKRGRGSGGHSFPGKEQRHRSSRPHPQPGFRGAYTHLQPSWGHHTDFTAKWTRLLAEASHLGMTCSPARRLIRKPQLPSYLVCSDEEQNLIGMRRKPQLAKPGDVHLPHSPMPGSGPRGFL